MIRVLIAPTDEAVTEPVPVPRNFFNGAVVTIGSDELNGSEKIVLWERWSATGQWQLARQWGAASETFIEVTATSGSVDIVNPSRRLGVTKTATNYPVGVYAASQDNIGT